MRGKMSKYPFCPPKRLLGVLLTSEPRMKRVVAERRKALTKAIEGLGQHGLVGTSDESLLSLHEALKVQFEVVQKVVYICSSLLQLTPGSRGLFEAEKKNHCCYKLSKFTK